MRIFTHKWGQSVFFIYTVEKKNLFQIALWSRQVLSILRLWVLCWVLTAHLHKKQSKEAAVRNYNAVVMNEVCSLP